MARSDYVTKLPLDEWARQMQVNPLHFNGVQIPETESPGPRAEGAGWFQSSWQTADGLSRDGVAIAIQGAEKEIEERLGYSLIPEWREDEWAPTTRRRQAGLFNITDRDVRGLHQGVNVKHGQFITGGIRASTIVEGDAAIVYTNTVLPTDYDNLATVEVVFVSEAVPDLSEVHAYYPGKGGDPAWEIRPIEVSLKSGTTDTVTIQFSREQALVESFMTSLELQSDGLRAANGEDNDNFLTTVDVYRVYNDPSQQATVLWEPAGECACSEDTCDGTCGACRGCSYQQQTACLLIRGDPRDPNVLYNPAEWDADSQTFRSRSYRVARQPDLVRVWYYAGYRSKQLATPTITMEPLLARAVAQMAAARLNRQPKYASNLINLAQEDLAFVTGADQLARYQISKRNLGNPFGTRRGEVTAWLIVDNLMGEQAPVTPAATVV